MQLGDFLTLQRGFDITKKEQRPGPYWVISSSGPSSRHAEHRVRGPGVVIGRKGSLGGVYFSQADFWPHDTTLWVKDFKGNEPLFTYYLLKTLGLERFDVGAANPTLNRNHLHLLSVSAPSRPEQRRIAAVLAAYDELIENNLRRIEILEEMARALYQEWFVNFRFPGHEDALLVDSPLGPTPEGWSVKSLGEVAEYVSRGISPKYDETSTMVVLNQKCIRDHRVSFGPSRTHTTKVKSEKVVRRGDVLVNSTGVGTLGRVAQLRCDVEEMTVDSHVTIIRPPTGPAEYWGGVLVAKEAVLERLGAGATGQTELSRSAIEALQIVVPPEPVTRLYSAFVRPMDDLAENLTAQNVNLCSTRDLLLPKLVSGEIDLSELDIETEWLAS